MTYDRRRIRDLTTPSEFELVDAGSARAIGRLSRQALQSHIVRVRRLRDKQRDLLRRQRLASRARTGTKHGGNARTKQKAELFEQTLSRFTKRLESMKASKKRSQAGKTHGQAALRQKARTPRMKAMQAHVSSRGRRKQARRDSR